MYNFGFIRFCNVFTCAIIFIFVNRVVYRTNDLWAILEQNWNFFYWLTGELPISLQMLVNQIQNTFVPQIVLGRPPILDLRNQVSLLFHYKCAVCEIY